MLIDRYCLAYTADDCYFRHSRRVRFIHTSSNLISYTAFPGFISPENLSGALPESSLTVIHFKRNKN